MAREWGGYSSSYTVSSEGLLAAGSTSSSTNRAGKLFGSGIDGDVTISTNVFLSRDMYYNNLTVNSGYTLFTNGFKVFVKGTLTNNGTIGMPSGVAATTAVMAGSVLTRDDGTGGYNANRALAGNAPASIKRDIDSTLAGVYQDGSSVSRFYIGQVGTAGTSNPGNPGSGGGSTAGNPGTGGAAGQAGGTVVVMADTIAGSGTFVAAGGAGGSGSPGTAGTTINGTVSHNPPGSTHHGHGHCNENSNCGAHHARPDNPNHCHYHHPASGCNPAPHHNHPGNSYHNPTYPGGTAGSGNPGNPGADGALLVAARTLGINVSMTNSPYSSIADL